MVYSRDRVNMKDGIICLKSEDTKERKGKRVPICETLYAILSKLPRYITNDHVFLYYGKPIEKRFETALKAACEEAK